MSKFGRAMSTQTTVRNAYVEDEDDGTAPQRRPLDFIDRREAQKRAAKLIGTIGRDNARAVVDTLRHGFSAGSWKILSELQRLIVQ